MKDRIPTKILDNGAIRYGVYDESETLLRYEYMKAEDAPSQLGTPLNKNTLLKDATASKIGLTQSNPTVDDAFNGIQDKVNNHTTQISNLNSQYTSLFQSVSDGKQLVASAITDKGVPTAPDATFQTLHDNVLEISSIPAGVYKIDLTASPSIGGVVSSSGYASGGMKIQVDASPTNGYTFNGWKKSGTTVSSNTSYLFQVTGNTSLTAEFEEEEQPTSNWVKRTLPISATWRGLVYGNEKFLAFKYDGYSFIYSSNGNSWQYSSNMPRTAKWQESAYGNGKYVVISYGTSTVGGIDKAAYSEDGENWEDVSLPFQADWESVAYGNGKFVAVAYGNSTPIYSANGKNWQASSSELFGQMRNVAYGAGKFIVLGGYRVGYSTDGSNWGTEIFNNISVSINKAVYGNGKFVAINSVGNSSKAAYSTDGLNWTECNLPKESLWDFIAHGNGKFIILNRSEDIAAYSEDGINWESIEMPESGSYWKEAAYGNGKMVVITNDKAVYTDW